MSEHPIHELDDDVHQRVRLGILQRELAALRRIMAQVDGSEVEASERAPET